MPSRASPSRSLHWRTLIHVPTVSRTPTTSLSRADQSPPKVYQRNVFFYYFNFNCINISVFYFGQEKSFWGSIRYSLKKRKLLSYDFWCFLFARCFKSQVFRNFSKFYQFLTKNRMTLGHLNRHKSNFIR